jgi:hypothetical protein
MSLLVKMYEGFSYDDVYFGKDRNLVIADYIKNIKFYIDDGIPRDVAIKMVLGNSALGLKLKAFIIDAVKGYVKK